MFIRSFFILPLFYNGIVKHIIGGIDLKFFKRGLASFLVIMMIFSLFPVTYAADNESVLTSIGHSDTNTVNVSSPNTTVQLTSSYGTSGNTINLSKNLAITYDESLYKNVVVEADSNVVVDGNAVSITVTYNDINDADDTQKHTTTYSIKVVSEAAKAAEFSGTIRKTGAFPGIISFSASDFEDKYEKNDGDELGYVIITGTNLRTGTLKLFGSDYVSGTQISVNDLANLTFATAAGGVVSYNVKAYTKSNASTSVGTAILTISVSAISVPTINSTITKSSSISSPLAFSLSTFSGFYNLNSGTLTSIEITPTNTEFGAWYAGTTAFTGTKVFTSQDIDTLSFTGSAAGSATFKWRVSNEAGFSEYGTGTIGVSIPELKLTSYSVSSSVIKGGTHVIMASHFKYTPTSADLGFVKITSIPSSGDGYLYLTTALEKDTAAGYPAIDADKALVSGAIIPNSYLRYLRLATKSTTKSDSVSFSWTATTDTTVTKTTKWATDAKYTVGFAEMKVITYDTDLNSPISLDASDFTSEFSDATNYTLSYVVFTLPKSTCGKLYYNYDFSTGKGTAVTASAKYYKSASPNLSNLTFVPTTDYVGSETSTYTAYAQDGTSTTGTLKFSVSSKPGGTITYSTDKDTPVKVDAGTFKTAFENATGTQLDYVKFTLPSSTVGKLYYNYASSTDYDSIVSASTKYYVLDSPYLSYITFMPYDDYSGTANITYTGYTESGTQYKGKLKINVIDSPGGIISYSARAAGTVTLSGDDFSKEFIDRTGSVLSYVKFATLDAKVGTLYYNYSSSTGDKSKKITTSTAYYNGTAADISAITFVPATGFTGTATINYTAYTSTNVAYNGKLKITIGEISGGLITYKTGLNTPLEFDASSFKAAFLSETGSALSYVKFVLPSISSGKLYYNYTSSTSYGSSVAEDTKYYAGTSPSVSDITLVPYTGYSGTFTVSYTGYTATGMTYSGKVKITVSNSNGTSVNYTTQKNTGVTLDADDFNTAYTSEAGSKLYYVKFTPPSSSYGKMYYDYTSAVDYGSTVKSSTKYYRSASPSLSSVTFVPNSGFAGRVVIPYTGYDNDGNDVSGSLIITVKDKSVSSINYTTTKNRQITFTAYDFTTKFVQESETSLYSVKFTVPTISYGKLYYNYVSASNPGTLVTNDTRYYRDEEPYLNNVTFVPFKDYVGDVTIDYTAYTSGGTSYAGDVVIAVNDDATVDKAFDDIDGYPWASDAINYLSNKKVVNGTGKGLYSPQNKISRGDFMLMIYKAFDLKATATNTTNFPDVKTGSYYYDAILAAKSLKVAAGSEGKFNPDQAISRQDAMVIIVNALKAANKQLTVGTQNDLSAFSDKGDVASYAQAAVSTLVKAGIISGNDGKIKPKDNITRAEMAVILYSLLTTA